MTPLELKAELGDVAQASLYRQIARLEQGGLIEIVGERRIRGSLERTYQVVEASVALGSDEIEGASRTDHLRYFSTFVASLLNDYGAYLDRGEPDLEADRVSYRQAALWLSDEEFDEMIEELREILRPRLAIGQAPDRRRRLMTTILMPGD